MGHLHCMGEPNGMLLSVILRQLLVEVRVNAWVTFYSWSRL